MCLGLIVPGCGSTETPPASVRLGTGELEFENLDEGADVYVVQGPQGGYHLYGSVIAQGINPGDPEDLGALDNPTTEFHVYRDGQRVDARASRYTQGLRPADGATYEMVGRLVILDITDDDEVEGASLYFEVTVIDVDGMSANDSRTVNAVSHPANL